MPKVMVLDDEEMVLRVVTRLLERVGYDTISFTDAAPALESGVLDDIEVIITDLNMPTSGEEFIQEVRGRGIDTPIIAMSGHLTEERSLFLKTIGVQEIVPKPFEIDDFIEAIENSLSVH